MIGGEPVVTLERLQSIIQLLNVFAQYLADLACPQPHQSVSGALSERLG